MKRGSKRCLLLAALTPMLGSGALAAVSVEEAKQLGGSTLTLFGAEKPGNTEGTIPAYSGVQPKAPAGWDPKSPGNRPDPYGEKPLYSITSQNFSQYAGKLDGMADLFKIYPNFRMDVYPSHRDVGFPQDMLDNTVKNATSCKAVDDELVLEGCYSGLPFPIPKTGNQVMWNHLLKYEFRKLEGKVTSWVVPSKGKPVASVWAQYIEQSPFYDGASKGPHGRDFVYWKVREYDLGPARQIGNQIVVLDALDQKNIGRRAYIYVPGQRRVKLAPDLQYDTPMPNSGGTSTMDDAMSFLGALDRYNFKLKGKKEKFIYYNNFKATDPAACPVDTLLSKNFPHPDCIRWELHRVWEVEASLKPNFRHIYAKRKFYYDEDGFAAGQAENYDASGKLYRLINTVFYPWFEEPGGAGVSAVAMDVLTGHWSTTGGVGFDKGHGWWPIKKVDPVIFSPEAMAAEGIR